MTKEMILEKVKAFPPLDDTVAKVMAICNDENGSVGELAQVVQGDPMTMANILKAANSPLYGFSREIKSVSQAVSIFGMDTVKGFAFSSFLQKKLDLNLTPYGVKAEKFTMVTEKQNAFAVKWFQKKRVMLDTLALTSFLMEMGKIVLANIVIEHGKAEEFQAHVAQTTSLEELEALEKQVFGISNEEVTSIIFKEWNFDETMCDAIKFLHHPEQASDEARAYAQALQVIKTLVTTQDYNQEEQIEKATQLVESYDLEVEKFHETLALHMEEMPA
jgi:HD-like signal output (HDOD) protein